MIARPFVCHPRERRAKTCSVTSRFHRPNPVQERSNTPWDVAVRHRACDSPTAGVAGIVNAVSASRWDVGLGWGERLFLISPAETCKTDDGQLSCGTWCWWDAIGTNGIARTGNSMPSPARSSGANRRREKATDRESRLAELQRVAHVRCA